MTEPTTAEIRERHDKSDSHWGYDNESRYDLHNDRGILLKLLDGVSNKLIEWSDVADMDDSSACRELIAELEAIIGNGGAQTPPPKNPIEE